MTRTDTSQSDDWWRVRLFGIFSAGIAIVIIMLGIILSVLFGSFGFAIACAIAFFAAPFGFLAGLLGTWKDKANEAATLGIILNVVVFVIGLFFNPIALIGGHNLH